MRLVSILIYLLCEFYFFGVFVDEFGFFTLLLEIIISGLLGFGLLLTIGSNLRPTINSFSVNNLLGSLFARLVGSILLILPGILTDAIGITLCIVSFFLRKNVIDNANQDNASDIKDNNIIDVEIENDRKL